MDDPKSLTREQQLAVDCEARRVCVDAGPGSGKTRVLVRRVADRVENGRLDPGRVLALTFTENAAGEMKQKLARRLGERGREPERRQLEQAYISTIHSFCARLLREHAIEAGVDPRFRVLDEIEAGLLKSRQLAATLEGCRRRDPDAYDEFARHFSGPVLGPLLEVYDAVRRLGDDPQDRSALLATGPGAEEILDQVEASLRNLERAAPRNPKCRQAAESIRQALARARGGAALADSVEALDQAHQALKPRRFDDPQITPSLRALDIQLEDLTAALVERAAAPHRRYLADLLAEFDRDYTKHKRRISALDFEDLEQGALQYLADEERAADAGARFQEILVDEYQDTSAVQARILERLSRHPRLFVVGDLKQSIYGFRNAEPANFEQAWRQAVAEQGHIPLRQDFRSRPEIIAAVNRFFQSMGAWTGAMRFEPLEESSDFVAKKAQDEPSVEMLIVCAKGKGAERRRQEALHLARRIRELIESGGLRITNRRHKEYGRKLEYRDVALLFRSTKDMDIYENALQEEGIPYFAETGRGFYDAREVADVVNFLRVLDNARDDVALAAVLRSPMFGLSDDALYLLAARERSVRLVDALSEAEALGLPEKDVGNVRRFGELFERLRQESAWRTLDSLVREIVAATDYETILWLAPHGSRRVANLRKLAEVAQVLGATAAVGLDSLGDFVRLVDRFRLAEIRESEAQLGSASEGAVRLMTIHAAKGLEFPVVILPDLGRPRPSERRPVDYWPGFGLGFEYKVREEDKHPTLALKNIRSEKQAREDEEEVRILFVAMTRAMEHLVLSGNGRLKKDGSCGTLGRLDEICSAFQMLQPLRPSHRRQTHHVAGPPSFDLAALVTDQALEASGARQPEAVEHAAEFSAGAPLAVASAPQAQVEARKMVDGALAPRAQPDQADFAASVTDVMELQACPRRYYLGRYLGFPQTEGEARAPEPEGQAEAPDEFPATDLGTAVHKLLAGAPDALAGLGEAACAEVERLARRFRESELGRRVAAMKDVRREEPIMGVVDGHFLRGKLDLRAGPLIVDYKTGQQDDRRYGLQMLLYGLLSGAKEAVLFYLAQGRAVPVELSPAAFEEARAVVRRFFEAQRTLDFPAVVERHCFQCAFSGNLCREPQKQRKGTHERTAASSH